VGPARPIKHVVKPRKPPTALGDELPAPKPAAKPAAVKAKPAAKPSKAWVDPFAQ
jgi:hypothetical protein